MCVTTRAMATHMPGALWRTLLRILLEMLKIAMHAKMLVGAVHVCRNEMSLLLTWLEVRAYHVLRTGHLLPRQQKRWREPNCYWIILQR